MKCLIEHKNYNQFEEVYGDQGVNLVHSILLDIPLKENIDNLLDGKTINELEKLRINKIKNQIYENVSQIFGDELSSSDILMVSNLGSSVAQFRDDGKLVFDSLLVQNNGVEYHEAFHRIFRMYLDSSERDELYEEVKRLNPDKPWNTYSRETEEDKIEELLADDFMLYSIEKNYKDKSIIAKFFFKLEQFLKKLFTRGDKLEKVYDKILSGGFKGKYSETPLMKTVNKYTLDDKEISVNDKNNIVFTMIESLTDTLFDKYNPYDFVEGNLSIEVLFEDMFENLKNKFHPKLYDAVEKDFTYNKEGIRQQFLKRLKEIGFKFNERVDKKLDGDEIANLDNEAKQDIEDEINGDKSAVDNADKLDSPAYESDPTNIISKTLKLRLSTLENKKNKGLNKLESETFGNTEFKDYLKFENVWKNLILTLAKSPSDIDSMIYLIKVTQSIPVQIKEQIIPMLVKYKDTNPRFVSDFVVGFSKSSYDYARNMLIDNKVVFKELTFGLKQAKLLEDISNKIYEKGDALVESLNKYVEFKNAKLEDVNRYLQSNRMNADDVRTVLLSEASGNNLETIDKKLKQKDNMSPSEVAELEAKVKILTELKKKVRSYAKLIIIEEGLGETMHTTVDGKPIYGISLDTTLSKNFKILNYIQEISNPITKDVTYDELIEAYEEFLSVMYEEGYEAAVESILDSGFSPLILLNHHLPHQINPYSMRMSESGNLLFNSDTLSKMFKEEITPTLLVMDGMEESISGSDEKALLGELSSSELHLHMINNLWNNVFDTIKHSDRGTFYQTIYKDKEENIINPFNLKVDKDATEANRLSSIFAHTIKNLMERLLVAEKAYYNNTKDSYIQYQSRYFENGKMRNSFSDMFTVDETVEIKNYFDSNLSRLDIKDTDFEKMIDSKINKWLIVNQEDWIRNMQKDDILTSDKKVKSPYLKTKDNKTYTFFPTNSSVDVITSFSFCNAVMFHMEEQMILYGHFSQYKDSDDLYKRMNTHSGTGRAFDQSESTNLAIQEDYNKEFTIRDLKTGKVATIRNSKYEVDPTPYINITTFNEYDKYKSKDLVKAKSELKSSLTNLTNILIAEGNSREEAEKVSEIKLKLYSKAYESMNLPDGQSYCSIFYFKEHKKRLGEWTPQHEILFDAELEVMSIDTTKGNPQVEAHKILHKAYQNIQIIENLEIEKANDIVGTKLKPLTLQQVIEKHLHSFEVLKPQYGGPTTTSRYQDKFNDRIYSYGINKTSFFPLVPSVIIGTGLHQLHNIILENGIDITSMQSATKTGSIDYRKYGQHLRNKKVSEPDWNYLQAFDLNSEEEFEEMTTTLINEGLEVYNKEGKFNPLTQKVFREARQYLSWTFMKDQVKIHDHPKEEIRNSTQAMKNVLANTMVKGVPIDILYKQSEWDAIENSDLSYEEKEELKKEISPLYKNIKQYFDSLKSIIAQNLQELIDEIKYEEIGDTIKEIKDFSRLKEMLIAALEDRGSPQNMVEAIELFANSQVKILETMSNKSKIEPIIYSLISKIISFKRPGNSVPMVSSQLLEPFDTTKTDRDTVSDVLKDYEIGKPAEVILPLPRSMFNKVIKAVNRAKGTRYDNILDALPVYNEMLASGEREFVFKGLRIPNQQYSSTDILKVKEFKFPSAESFIFVYGEIVSKTGGD